MIHQVRLSEKTLARLNDIVALQIHLLYYAAYTVNFSRESCRTYLNNWKRYQGCSERIVKWIWDAPINRRGKLQSFAQCYESIDDRARLQEQHRKQAWIERLYCEALAFSRQQDILIEETYDERSAPSWQRAGAEFLMNFYYDLCSGAKLPAYLFTEANALDFGRQEFLKEFTSANPDLYVCAVCDESAYYTVVEGVIYTDIDHYLPKSRYPHFSCHPYNLIPTCLLCNQRVKEKKDPFATFNGQRRKLNEIFLPYQEGSGLGHNTYLKASFNKGEKGEERLHLEELIPYTEDTQDSQQGESLALNDDSTSTQKIIGALADVYRVPQRWDPDKIGETLFRRMRQFLHGNEGILLGSSTLKDDARVVLISALDQLLYCFQSQEEGDRGKDPLTFAMASLLATLMNDEIEAPSSSLENSVLIQEIVCWFKESRADNLKRTQQAKKLREIMKKKKDSSNN